MGNTTWGCNSYSRPYTRCLPGRYCAHLPGVKPICYKMVRPPRHVSSRAPSVPTGQFYQPCSTPSAQIKGLITSPHLAFKFSPNEVGVEPLLKKKNLCYIFDKITITWWVWIEKGWLMITPYLLQCVSQTWNMIMNSAALFWSCSELMHHKKYFSFSFARLSNKVKIDFKWSRLYRGWI